MDGLEQRFEDGGAYRPAPTQVWGDVALPAPLAPREPLYGVDDVDDTDARNPERAAKKAAKKAEKQRKDREALERFQARPDWQKKVMNTFYIVLVVFAAVWFLHTIYDIVTYFF